MRLVTLSLILTAVLAGCAAPMSNEEYKRRIIACLTGGIKDCEGLPGGPVGAPAPMTACYSVAPSPYSWLTSCY